MTDAVTDAVTDSVTDAVTGSVTDATVTSEHVADEKRPLYPRLLRLRHIHPNSWQRALLGEGMVAGGALLAMADLASAWSIVVLPVAVGGVVKCHDLLAGRLAHP